MSWLSPDGWQAVALSLRVSLVATVVALPFAVAVAYALARGQFRGRGVLNAVVHLPLILPPVVTGYLLLVFGIVVWLKGRKSAHVQTQFAFNAVMAALVLQIVLGITTVLYAAPVHIALPHQALAVVLWVLILRARFLSAYPIATSLRGSKT